MADGVCCLCLCLCLCLCVFLFRGPEEDDGATPQPSHRCRPPRSAPISAPRSTLAPLVEGRAFHDAAVAMGSKSILPDPPDADLTVVAAALAVILPCLCDPGLETSVP